MRIFGAIALGVVLVSSPAKAQDTIRIGILHSLSGSMAPQEAMLKDAVLMLVDEQNKKGGVLDKKIEAVVVDPASNWPLFAEKARELITKDKVSAIFGCWASVSCRAVLPVVSELNGILFNPSPYNASQMPQTSGRTGPAVDRNVFYLGASPDQLVLPIVNHLLNKEGFQRWLIVGTDYPYSRDINKTIEERLRSRNISSGDIMMRYASFGSTDWGSIVSSLKGFGSSGKKTAVISTLAGDDKVQFLRAIREQNANGVTVAIFPESEGELAGLDANSARYLVGSNYLQSINTSANVAFIKSWRQFTKNSKSVVTPGIEAHAIGFAMWIEAVKRQKTADPDKVIAALPGISVPTLTGGTAKMFADHHINKPLFLGQLNPTGVLRADGRWPSIEHCGPLQACGQDSPPITPGDGGDTGGSGGNTPGSPGLVPPAGGGVGSNSGGGDPCIDPAMRNDERCKRSR
ncbi:transporter substrate-binding protein [Bradyrhizobium diazoefficiens]|uniref:transporter substrate-binding protein n=1 Tax=Bradyrhizobium diazoefficiens TaxID=1355477 RepID=UPI0004B3BA2F|nr:transporter substrate-binding protein [Bradyrhizobium diazoefficiens]